ncbi:hypothetical protein ACK9YZ_30260 [Rhizobium sp. ZK1]|uniref:hypothetical protein n=1 Tax=Rhizobium sp. ZK1 TaxID=3389872 RepID=UPI0039F6CE05
MHSLEPACKVVHIGQDPLYSRFPVRNFHYDLALVGDTAEVIIDFAAAASMFLPTTAGRLLRRLQTNPTNTPAPPIARPSSPD